MAKKKRGVLASLKMESKVATKEQYEDRLEALQLQMLRIQQAYFHQRKRAVLVFEGADAAGKGGAIRRLTEKMDPRGVHVWPIAKPTAEEQGRHYLYRFWQKLPAPGTIAVFDRSWYGRVLVERAEGFASRDAWQRSYEEINAFERMLTDDGARVVKIFLHITQDEQLKRFKERLINPYKRWKIGEEDIRNRKKWPAYEEAIEDMFKKTSTKRARWHVIPGDHKWHARVTVAETVTRALSADMSIAVPQLDVNVQHEAARQLGIRITDKELAAADAQVRDEEKQLRKKWKS